jgi:hypothetical protein
MMQTLGLAWGMERIMSFSQIHLALTELVLQDRVAHYVRLS